MPQDPKTCGQATFELQPYVLHDTPSRRLVRSFGLAQVAGAYDAGPAAPIPAGLKWLRKRCAALMGREPEELVQLLVTRYPPGAGSAGTAMRRSSATSPGLAADAVPDAVPTRPALPAPRCGAAPQPPQPQREPGKR